MLLLIHFIYFTLWKPEIAKTAKGLRESLPIQQTSIVQASLCLEEKKSPLMEGINHQSFFDIERTLRGGEKI